MIRGATPVADVAPSLSSGSAKSPSKVWVRASSKSYQRRPPVRLNRSVRASDAGDVGRDVLDALRAPVAQRPLRRRDHREGHGLEVLLALAGGDGHRHLLGEVRRISSFQLGRRRLLLRTGPAGLLRAHGQRDGQQQGAERPESSMHRSLRDPLQSPRVFVPTLYAGACRGIRGACCGNRGAEARRQRRRATITHTFASGDHSSPA